MKILIIGSCRNNDAESKVKRHVKLAAEIGKELALRGHEIITGGAGGLQGILASAYKKKGGKKWVVYFAIGEKKDKSAKPRENVRPDEAIQTKYNYAMRDLFYIGKSDAVIALSGKLLTFAEIVHAVRNYGKRVFQLAIGGNIPRIKKEKELKSRVFIATNISKGLNFLES